MFLPANLIYFIYFLILIMQYTKYARLLIENKNENVIY